MSTTKLITLLTDFGLSDGYVGVMKGVIAQINPHLPVIDLTHEIPPQNIAAGRFCLMNAYPFFPVGTVHIAVVDPGVGSHRRSIAVQCEAGFLVGPDNGLFSGVLEITSAIAAVQLTHPKFWRTPQPSTTFHGRDIFASVGVHLASGVPLEQLGTAIDPESLVRLPLSTWIPTNRGAEGCIQYIDRFGNLVTNIPGNFVAGKTWSVVVAKTSPIPLSTSPETQNSQGLTISCGQTYSDADKGQAIALIGSHGWIEIAVNGGHAQSSLQLEVGTPVQISCPS